MFAIIEVGAKQFNVKKDDIIEVERLEGKPGKEIHLHKVLLLSKDKKVEIGQPYLKGTAVEAVVLAQCKGPKITNFKYRRRKASHQTIGYRAPLTRLKIKEIKAG
jgi:large subunit ribosomal protein L21